MLNFFKPTKLKLVLLLLIWITLWSSIKIEKAVSPVALELAFPKMTSDIKEAFKSISKDFKDKVEEISKELNTEPKMIGKVAFILLIPFLSKALPCYLCSCIIVFLMKDRR